MTAHLPRGRWSSDIHAGLVTMLDSEPPGSLAIFDWDDTMIAGDISYALMRYVDAHHGRTLFNDYHRLLIQEGRYRAYPQITRWFAGATPAELNALAQVVLDDAFSSGRIALREELVDLKDHMVDRGWRTHVISASPAFIVRAAAQRAGIPPACVIAMELETEPDGRLSDQIVEPAPMLEGKLAAIRAHLDSDPTFCAGDSRSDATMMAASRHALLIDAGDADLHAEANTRGWWVQRDWPTSPPEPLVRTEPTPP